jgi:hypothetical protein
MTSMVKQLDAVCLYGSVFFLIFLKKLIWYTKIKNKKNIILIYF